ncbi:MAG TPA: WecB/TagA/CpsF family glycosyltransferase [Patescibacteria group bacterium]|nr:WecB/TagA/CpsF family glycosyltransferase [Patescibacteria group bacterium]
MSLHAVKMLGINITNSSKEIILKEIQKSLEFGRKWGNNSPKNGSNTIIIVTPNPEQVVYAKNHSRFRDILNRADIAIPDGVGLVWASKILFSSRLTIDGLRLTSAIPGIDLMQSLVQVAEKRHVPIALIGGGGDLALKTFECLQQKFPGVSGLAMSAPKFVISPSGLAFAQDRESGELQGREFRQNDGEINFTLGFENVETYVQKVTEKLKDAGVQMVFVGLGAPKQEYLIERLSLSLRGVPNLSRDDAAIPTKREIASSATSSGSRNDKKIILMSVGGSFDVIAGRIRRAPVLVRSIGFEWFWRLLKEPWRIRRQLALLKFVFLVMKERYRLK